MQAEHVDDQRNLNADSRDTLRVVVACRFEAIQAVAQGAGLDFFAPAARHGLDETIARIHQRAEMVTPLLDEILHHHHSAPRWEQNA